MADEPSDTDGTEVRRINVAVTEQTVAALELVTEKEGVSLTEAVRRLTGYGEFVYRAMRERDEEMLLRMPDGSIREVVLR